MTKSKNVCRGKLKVLKRENGYSAINEIFGGNSSVEYTDYKCEFGHKYTTTGRDKECMHSITK